MSAGFTIVNIGTLSMNKFWGESERVRAPTATCVLLESGKRRLLVDPSPQADKLEAMLFARTGLQPADVDVVFCTHWHGDHRFGLDLFPHASWLMAAPGLEEWRAQKPEESELIDRFVAAEAKLTDSVHLFPSPGHTMGHYSLLVGTRWGRLIVAGDAVMTPDFYDAEEGYHNCVDFELATQTIRTIKQSADLVIPGHGNLLLA